ncbi:hypothetical protein PSR1_04454 [Anaeromyxobacter sp. PSR-1]|nr:hypothetical protein PSR1_04454 [Anaeromyxobacter sp. PSR-1]
MHEREHGQRRPPAARAAREDRAERDRQQHGVAAEHQLLRGERRDDREQRREQRLREPVGLRAPVRLVVATEQRRGAVVEEREYVLDVQRPVLRGEVADQPDGQDVQRDERAEQGRREQGTPARTAVRPARRRARAGPGPPRAARPAPGERERDADRLRRQAQRPERRPPERVAREERQHGEGAELDRDAHQAHRVVAAEPRQAPVPAAAIAEGDGVVEQEVGEDARLDRDRRRGHLGDPQPLRQPVQDGQVHDHAAAAHRREPRQAAAAGYTPPVLDRRAEPHRAVPLSALTLRSRAGGGIPPRVEGPNGGCTGGRTPRAGTGGGGRGAAARGVDGQFR